MVAPSQWLRRPTEARQRLQRDLIVAIRSLRRTPAFAITTIVILALGIGTSAAMFTIYKGLLVDRFPIVDQDHVLIMHPLDRSGTHLDIPYSYLEDIRRDTSMFKAVAGVYHITSTPAPYTSGGESISLVTSVVTANFFTTLGVRPFAGRLLHDEDGDAGAIRTMVLSYHAWQRRYAGNTKIVGQTLTEPYAGELIRIVGVAPPGFTYPAGTEAWLITLRDFALQVDIVARIASNATPESARAALNALMKRTNPFATEPRANARFIPIAGSEVRTFTDNVVGNARATVIGVTLARCCS